MVWGGNRAKGIYDGDNFAFLVDATQNGFNYTPIIQGCVSDMTWGDNQLSVAFTTSSFWQINALCLDSIG